jgi:hypothetical protein
LFQFVVGLGLSGCSREPARFVEGAESVGLTQKVTGYLTLNQGWDAAEPARPRILAISFPDLKQSIVREGWAWTLNGPNKQGRIAFSDDKPDGYQIKTILLDGTNEELIFEKPGTPYDACLAISPIGDRIAFVGGEVHSQNPGAYLAMGKLEIWDTVKKESRDTHIIALSQPIYWSPDGRELAFVILADRKNIPNNQRLPGSPNGTDEERKYGHWDRYPAVHILNTETGEERFLCAGWHALFSPDWKTTLVRSGDEYLQVDMDTGQSTSIKLPLTIQGSPQFLLSNDFIVFRGPPTAGATPRWLKRGSFKVGTQMDAIKIGDIRSGDFQTVVPYADFRDDLSYGVIAEPALSKKGQ